MQGQLESRGGPGGQLGARSGSGAGPAEFRSAWGGGSPHRRPRGGGGVCVCTGAGAIDWAGILPRGRLREGHARRAHRRTAYLVRAGVPRSLVWSPDQLERGAVRRPPVSIGPSAHLAGSADATLAGSPPPPPPPQIAATLLSALRRQARPVLWDAGRALRELGSSLSLRLR